MRSATFFLVFWILALSLPAQTSVNIFPDSVVGTVGKKFQPGVFYVPKTTEAQADFNNNGIRQNSIRLHVIESVLNNTSNLAECLALLDTIRAELQFLSGKTDNLLFIFEKMPAWLSSSSDGSPAMTPGWFVLNTKPPASYSDWNAMVSSVVDRIVNTYGISNAQFEIWNEPDLGSWTAGKDAYFKLYRNTYDAIKSVGSTVPVGGPATNHWAKNIGYQPPFGYLRNQIADSSLIGELLDSSLVWNRPLDFISWHTFDLATAVNGNAVAYITQKCAGLGIPVPQLYISEWNTPSVVRDTPLQMAFFAKYQMELSRQPIVHNMVAAWQDFEQSTNEFHNDYGLLTFGAIHKPAYKAIQLSSKLQGDIVQFSPSAPVDLLAARSGDTLRILVANYAPLPFLEAFYHTLFEGGLNTYELDSAGFIDVAGNDISRLDSIYQGLIVIPNSSPIHLAINNSISTYSHFAAIESTPRRFELNVSGAIGIRTGKRYTVDSTTNNAQFRYDSLRTQGFTQAGAIALITSDQSLTDDTLTMTNGEMTLEMQPNSVCLVEFVLPSLLYSDEALADFPYPLLVYPNPTEDRVEIRSAVPIGKMTILNPSGQILGTRTAKGTACTLDFSGYASGAYFVHFTKLNQTVKVIRN